jgi:hypothetical protein
VHQITYSDLVRDYRREFSAYRKVRKYTPERWLIFMILQVMMTLSIAAYGLAQQSFLFILIYLGCIGLISWQFHRRSKSIVMKRARKYNTALFIQFLIQKVFIEKAEPIVSLRDLLSISNSHLSRPRTSTKFRSLFTIILASPLLGALPNFIATLKPDATTIALIIILGILIIALLSGINPVLSTLLDMKYDKEIEFRNRVERLILNYNKKDWEM